MKSNSIHVGSAFAIQIDDSALAIAVIASIGRRIYMQSVVSNVLFEKVPSVEDLSPEHFIDNRLVFLHHRKAIDFGGWKVIGVVDQRWAKQLAKSTFYNPNMRKLVELDLNTFEPIRSVCMDEYAGTGYPREAYHGLGSIALVLRSNVNFFKNPELLRKNS